MPITWEAIGVLVALAVTLTGVGAQIWRGGRMQQRFETMEGDMEGLKDEVDKHGDELAAGRARFTGMETKIDLMLSQQRQTLDRLDRLADRKD